MILRYRVSLAGLKGFARVYELKSTTTLYDFHKRMRDDLDLPHDQLILFKAMDGSGCLVARYGVFDLGAGVVDEISLADTLEKGVKSFVYFYNVTERKSLVVTFEAECEDEQGVTYPRIVESKGPNPADFENGYVAYEDLPDDQKHLPGESSAWDKDASAKDKDDDDFDLDLKSDDDFEDDDDEDDVEDDMHDGDADEIYDGTEDLNL